MKPLRRLKVYQFASCDQRAWNSNVFKCKVSLLFERDWTRNSWGIPPPSAQGGDTAAESRRFIFVGWGVKQYLSPSFTSFYYFTLTLYYLTLYFKSKLINYYLSTILPIKYDFYKESQQIDRKNMVRPELNWETLFVLRSGCLIHI